MLDTKGPEIRSGKLVGGEATIVAGTLPTRKPFQNAQCPRRTRVPRTRRFVVLTLSWGIVAGISGARRGITWRVLAENPEEYRRLFLRSSSFHPHRLTIPPRSSRVRGDQNRRVARRRRSRVCCWAAYSPPLERGFLEGGDQRTDGDAFPTGTELTLKYFPDDPTGVTNKGCASWIAQDYANLSTVMSPTHTSPCLRAPPTPLSHLFMAASPAHTSITSLWLRAPPIPLYGQEPLPSPPLSSTPPYCYTPHLPTTRPTRAPPTNHKWLMTRWGSLVRCLPG